MISVRSSGRDARTELGLGFSGRRSEMDDTELEEGEACFHHHNNDEDFDASTDPDVALSYIVSDSCSNAVVMSPCLVFCLCSWVEFVFHCFPRKLGFSEIAQIFWVDFSWSLDPSVSID